MPKVLVVQPFHEDGMKLLKTRSDVVCEVADGALVRTRWAIASARR